MQSRLVFLLSARNVEQVVKFTPPAVSEEEQAGSLSVKLMLKREHFAARQSQLPTRVSSFSRSEHDNGIWASSFRRGRCYDSGYGAPCCGQQVWYLYLGDCTAT